MKKRLKVLIPIVILAVTLFGGVIYAYASFRLTVVMADGTAPGFGGFYMAKNQSADFNVIGNGAEIAPGNKKYTVTWSSSDETVISIDPNTGAAVADKDGLMPGISGKATITVTAVEIKTGKVMKRSYTVNVTPGNTELITVISGINEGMELEAGMEYTLISRTYTREGDTLTIANNQLFCSYSCDRVEIVSGKFTPAEAGVYRIITIGYASEKDLNDGKNEVMRDVLEVYVYADPTPTPKLTPTPKPTPTPEPTPTPTATPTLTPEPSVTPDPGTTPAETPTPTPDAAGTDNPSSASGDTTGGGNTP